MNDLSPRHLARAYAARERDPQQVLNEVYDRIARNGSSPVWTHVRPYESLLRDLEFAEANIRPDARGPLFGVPFAV
ncbi:MAG TPA: hypothetical protein VFQ61_34440, partial [Polyangiaceae bacterium]|nr:hypothetical protein [Polyangiaceae bacterium]